MSSTSLAAKPQTHNPQSVRIIPSFGKALIVGMVMAGLLLSSDAGHILFQPAVAHQGHSPEAERRACEDRALRKSEALEADYDFISGILQDQRDAKIRAAEDAYDIQMEAISEWSTISAAGILTAYTICMTAALAANVVSLVAIAACWGTRNAALFALHKLVQSKRKTAENVREAALDAAWRWYHTAMNHLGTWYLERKEAITAELSDCLFNVYEHEAFH